MKQKKSWKFFSSLFSSQAIEIFSRLKSRMMISELTSLKFLFPIDFEKCRYCCKVNKKLRNPGNKHKQIVHCTSGQNQQKKANAAYLFTSYAVIYLNRSPRVVYASLIEALKQPLKPFQDASMGVSMYNIRLQGSNPIPRNFILPPVGNFSSFFSSSKIPYTK